MQLSTITVDDCDLAAFCEQYGVAKLSLFGSVLRDDFDSSRSDVDVLIEFRPAAIKSLFTLVRMEQRLSRLFGRTVDLNTPGSLSKYFRDEVMESAEVLYAAA
jgi:predicted nucleotidyltransferase